MPRHATMCSRVLVCVLLTQACGPRATELPGERQAAITDGTPHGGHPSVGLMVAKGSTSCSGPLVGAACTVTLVGQRTVLTAAHCLDPGEVHIICFDSGTTYKPQKLAPHSAWDAVTLANDIGLVVLDAAPPIVPSLIARSAPTTGQQITLIGFGSTGETLTDAGTKRIATNTIKDLWATRFSYAGTGNGTGNTCHGDSGSPAFATLDGQEVQVGVTSAGLKPCGALGYSTRVDAYLTWLEQTSGGDLYDGDEQKPVVSILEPADGATVSSVPLAVKVSASDNVAVVEVELLVDGTSQAKRSAAPFTFSLSLAEGTHVLRALGRDAAGNVGEAQASVTFSPSGVDPLPEPDPGSFGAECATNEECQSRLCATYDETILYCTLACEPDGPSCPSGAECLPSGATRSVCGPPAATLALADGGQLVGGCGVGQRAPGFGLLAALGLLGLMWLRRRPGRDGLARARQGRRRV